MVLLRLTVKVFPREQLGQPSTPDSGVNDNAAHKAMTFLMVLWKPEQVKLGKLAYMIQEKWKRLKPDAAPLEIKKLVDDKHAEDTLDAELTVADVFVDSGKALADGLDQRGVIRVIQQPGRPERYGSVVQDWAAVTKSYARIPPVPLFSDPPRNRHRLTTTTITRFTEGPAPGPSHPSECPESDYSLRSNESGEERLNREDNHTHASPILVEDSQKPRNFSSSAGKSRDLPNDEPAASTGIRGSGWLTQEEEIGYRGTLLDALRYDYSKQEAAMRDMDRLASLRGSLPQTRTLAPHSPLSNPKLRLTSSTNNNSSSAAAPNKRQVEVDDIYAIPSTDQESKKAKTPQPTKRRRRNISRSDELTMQHNLETFLVSPGDKANNAIILDSDIGEDKPAGQVQEADSMVDGNQSGVRRGTRKSIIRGPGRKSMALKLPFTPAENAKIADQGSAAATTKTPPKKKAPVTIADSDIEIVDGPKPTQTTNGDQGDVSPPRGYPVVGENRHEGDRNVRRGADVTKSTKKSSTPMSSTYQPTHLDAKASKPIYSDIPDSETSDDALAPSPGARNNIQVTTPKKTPQKPTSAPVDRPRTPGNGSASKLRNGSGALGLTKDSDNHTGRLSHSSPTRPRGPQELGQGITASAVTRGRAASTSQPATISDGNGNYRTGVSTTPAFPRPRPASQVQTERRGSMLESEKTNSGDLRTPVMPALRSAQKSSPRTVSTRRSVSFVDDPKVDKQSTPASASSVKVGNVVYPPGVTPEWVQWMRTDGELQKKINGARLQGKSEDYCQCVDKVKYLTKKLYDANSKKIASTKIAEYERRLKKAKEIVQNHPEEDRPAQGNPGEGHHERNHREEDENGEANSNYEDGMVTSNGSRNKSQGLTGLDGTSQKDSPNMKKPSIKEPTDVSAFNAILAPSSLDVPSTGNFAVEVSLSSSRSNGASGMNVEGETVSEQGSGLKRKRPEWESVNAPNGSKHPRSDREPHPELESKETNANVPDYEPLGEPQQRNGKAPVRDARDSSAHMSSLESSSSDLDSDSESDSNLMPAKDRIGNHSSLPPCGGSARRSLITPFRDLKKNWPKSSQWFSDEASGPEAENTRTTGTVGFGAPSFSQPAPSTSLKTSRTKGDFGASGRDTLKTLIRRQRGSEEDESSAKNASENDSLPAGSNWYPGYNILRRTGLLR
ncbi:hypothetical protein EMCG_01346 [[Emmonsia] crescens]|uniref:Nucleolar protein Dnt1-like N-terminal domain-containing protein n=1 Tax=[Emmonsia] crescens TaxID=73230 RepID=A0A0G2JA48_9EURO|nr:hypothetical protein EMCG_01346 [Emmonsia crescens UAMH 3008]